MPSKNSVKIYVENGFYHVYNRGVEKRIIFEDEQDYSVFLKYLEETLSPPDNKINSFSVLQGQTLIKVERTVQNFADEIDLLAYCLMPNHFHFEIRQNSKSSIAEFMSSLMARYVMYFNKKYDRVGSLFQGRYKAVMISDESYLLHLSRYIHLNPSEDGLDLTKAHSSYADYLGLRRTSWLKPKVILDYFNSEVGLDFKKINNYREFVESQKIDSSEHLGDLTLE